MNAIAHEAAERRMMGSVVLSIPAIVANSAMTRHANNSLFRLQINVKVRAF